MTELFCYTIPDRFFAPHKVVVPFLAKVAYSVVKGKVKIEEVALSESACMYVRTGRPLVDDIKATIEKSLRNRQVHPTIISAIAPHI